MPAEIDPRSQTGIGKAVDAAGSFMALAKQLGIQHQPLHRWWKRGFVPPDRAKQIHDLYPTIPISALMDPYLVELATQGE